MGQRREVACQQSVISANADAKEPSLLPSMPRALIDSAEGPYACIHACPHTDLVGKDEGHAHPHEAGGHDVQAPMNVLQLDPCAVLHAVVFLRYV